MASDSTPRRTRGKAHPKKPRDFPLSIHKGSGYWCRKIRGHVFYFGKVADDPKGQAALEEWLRIKDDLLAGRTPRVQGDGLTVADLCNRFLDSKERLVTTGELRRSTWQEYYTVCAEVVTTFGKTRLVSDLAADDFERLRAAFAEHVGPTRLGKLVQIARSVAKYAFDNGLVDRPVRFGSGFSRPSKAVLRRHRAEQGPKLFTREEIRRMLDKANLVLRAMILLGVNCGLGNSDCGRLETRHLDLEGGWLDFARPKSGVARRAKLWAETVAAIRAALEVRPVPKDKALVGRVFITKQGNGWDKREATGGPVALMFGRLMRDCGIEKRAGRAFYSLRHVYRTFADGCHDQPAIALTMGHAPASGDMSAVYREEIDDSRLEAIAEHVRRWLFPEPADDQGEADVVPFSRSG